MLACLQRTNVFPKTPMRKYSSPGKKKKMGDEFSFQASLPPSLYWAIMGRPAAHKSDAEAEGKTAGKAFFTGMKQLAKLENYLKITFSFFISPLFIRSDYVLLLPVNKSLLC